MSGGIRAYVCHQDRNLFDAPIIVEDKMFPGMQLFPSAFVIKDEIDQASDIFSRGTVRVFGAPR